MTGVSTKTDLAANEGAIDDSVMRLREWGTNAVRMLPQPPSDCMPIHEWTVGSAETCALQFDDPSGRISRLHARLVRERSKWLLRDLGSKNGIRLDGASHPHPQIVLEPGAEIGIGGVTLIAESLRSIQLRGFLARLLGWRAERIEVIDHALRSIRLAVTRRAALVLLGGGDLVPIAHALHRRTLGAARPFIVCDPRRRQSRGDVRSAENYATGMAAFTAATGGSMCMRSRQLPREVSSVVAAFRAPAARVQLVICGQPSEGYDLCLAAPIAVPPLTSRPDEIDRIINEYAEDAITELGAHTGFLPADHTWVQMHSASSLPDIEKATLRLVAIRASRNLSAAAARLGMAPVSLSRWIGRRKLPMHVGA